MYTGHSFIEDTMTRSKDTFNLENKTSIGRLDKINNNFQIFKQHPIFGIGYNYENLADFIESPSLVIIDEEFLIDTESDILHPHNFIMRSLSHTGLVGTLILLSIIGIVLKMCYRLISAEENQRPYGILLNCTLVFFLIFSLLNTTFNSEGWFFWLLCGFTVTYHCNVKTHQTQKNIG